jgi:transposase
MAAAPWIVSDQLWELIEPLLPKREPSRRGGRSRHPDRATLSGILFVLHTGIAWRHLPAELGYGSGVHLLAAPGRVAARRCVGEAASAPARPAPRGRSD